MENIAVFNDFEKLRCMENDCSHNAVVALMQFNHRRVTRWETLCAEHATGYANAESSRAFSTPFSENRSGFLAVDLSLVAYCGGGSYFVLRDGSGCINVPVHSGAPEGYLAMQRFHEGKPGVFQLQMHEVFLDLVRQFGARLDSVAIVNVAESDDGIPFFESFASVVHGTTQLGIQVRASDALAIAVCGYLPIFVTEKVISSVRSLPPDSFPWEAKVGNEPSGNQSSA